MGNPPLAPKAKIIYKPLEPNQSPESIEGMFLQSIDEGIGTNSKCKIETVKKTTDGGLVVSCQDSASSAELIRLTESKFTAKYSIKEIKPHSPSIRLVGMSKNICEANIANYLVKQNSEIFTDASQVIVKKFWPTKKNPDIFQAIIEVEVKVYNTLMSVGQVLVGINLCTVFDALAVTRCFRCNAYNHTKRNCQRNPTCPRCAGAHELASCTNPDEKPVCINCTQHNARDSRTQMSCDHAAWDHSKCPSYRIALAKLRKDVFGLSSSV